MESYPDIHKQKAEDVDKEGTSPEEWRHRFDIVRTRLDHQVAHSIEDADLQEPLTVQIDQKEKIKTLQNFIETKVDFPLLQNLLGEVFRKAGAGDERLQRIKEALTPESVVFIDSEHVDGFVISGEGKVFIDIEGHLQKGEVKSGVFLDTLVHEFLHLTSERKHVGTDDSNFGLEHVSAHGEVTHSMFEGVDEGMTEMLKDCLVSEYLKRSGDTGNFSTNKDNLDTYEFQRSVLDIIISELSKEGGVSKETIFKGMVEAYCSNRSLFSEDIFGKIENPLLRKYLLLVSEVDSLQTSSDFGIKKKKTLAELVEQIRALFRKEDNSRYYVQALFGEDYLRH